MTEQQYFTLVTDIGKAAIANASITGEKVDFAKIKVGDGGGSSYTPNESQTALKMWFGKVHLNMHKEIKIILTG